MDMNVAFWALAAPGIAAAVAYGAYFLRRPPSLVRALVKTLFMAAFAAALISAKAPPPFVLAILLSALGDFFLAFDKKWILPFGILSFLLAQLLYVLMFTAIWFFSGDNAPLLPRYIAMGAVIVTAIVFLVWMAPKLGWMALGVVPYAIAVTGMGVAAMWLPWEGWPAMLGAVSFLVSDFVLAAELFRLEPDDRARNITTPVVWWTYATAQMLIITGLIVVVQSQ
ncbi:MAG: lysoplasmalogenase family protein, partial [Caulobacteraceae bacterium]